MALTPYFQFGNIKAVESASFPLSRGVSPSVCTISILPGTQIDRLPHLMTFGDGVRKVSFSQCRMADVSPQIDGSGYQTLTVSIFDRRWKWKFGFVSGTYNVRRGGKIIESTRKTPRQLAELCFEAVGETRYDVSNMPNGTFPYVNWEFETRVDSALDQLCQEVESHVAPRADNDSFVIYPDGHGQDLPNIPSSSVSTAQDFGPKPYYVAIATGPQQWQLDLRLEPVGLDVDNKIKPIDKLSYAPKGGWGYILPESFHGLPRYGRRLAAETVWKWFALRLPTGMEKMPGTNEDVTSIRQLLPLLDHQLDFLKLTLEQQVAGGAGALDAELVTRKPPQVFGVFYSEDGGKNNVPRFSDDLDKPGKPLINDDGSVTSTVSKLIYSKGFQIDNDRGIVMFGDPVYRLHPRAAERWQFIVMPRITFWPDIRLRVACNFRSLKTRAAYRHHKRAIVPGGFDKSIVAWESREDVVPEWNNKAVGRKDNLPEVNKELDLYLAHALREYEPKVPASGTYPWIVPASPDGRIAQVVYEIDSEGFCGTSIYREIEGLINLQSYEERRRAVARLATMEKLTRQLAKQDESKDKR